jgi:pimeloyl-ACP methyl ester carboxylesterase
MVKKVELSPADFIHPLNMNGLKGRMLYMPAPAGKKREILFVYGHHSSLERWWGVIQDLNQYGAITMPDLPGFGGMDSFYKIGEKPTIDNMADYLAAFIKLRYKRKKVTIAGLSFGFVVATRMLQRYPDLVKKVDLLVSVVGFAHYEDFTFTKPRYYFYRYASAFLSYRLPALMFRGIGLNPLVLRTVYRHTHNAKNKFKNVDKSELKKLMDFEVFLWHANEMRTHWATTAEFLKLNNCTKQVDAPVWHIAVSGDQYFDNDLVEQHFRVIFSDFHMAVSDMDSHAPSIIADVKTAAPLFPKKFRRVLAKD